jgi:hypothetical protein
MSPLPPARVVLAMALHPALSLTGAVTIGLGAALDGPWLVAAGAALTVLTVLVGAGAWLAYVGWSLRLLRRPVWVYAERGGHVRTVEHEDDVPLERRLHARRLTLFSASDPL